MANAKLDKPLNGSENDGYQTPRSFDSMPDERSSLLSDSQATERAPQATPQPGLDVSPGYGSSGRHRSSRTEEAFATLPTRLARSASIARKQERKERRSTMWKSFGIRSRYYIPVLNWLPHYNVSAFLGDVTAAFTLTSVIVPQAMSYASNLVGTDPVHGLFGAAIPAMIYSILGTCRQLSVGPEAALSLIMGEAIKKILDEETHAHGPLSEAHKTRLVVMLCTVITFEAGLIAFFLGLLRLGFLDAVLSRALLRGFITAVGIVIFVAQVPSVLGMEGLIAKAHKVTTTLDKVSFIIRHLGSTHRLTCLVSVVALTILICAKLFKGTLVQRRGFQWLAYVPEVLLVVILSTFFSSIFNWEAAGVAVLGRVSAGHVKLQFPLEGAGSFALDCLGTSTVIAILGFLDSIVGAKDSASRYDYPISPNRELVALGAANIGASFIGGTLPGYGSITRSRLAGATGATTQMASLLTGTSVLLVTYFLLGLLVALPKCVLAVIIIVVVYSILIETPHDVKFFIRMHAWLDGALMALTFGLTLFVGVEVGIIVSVALSCLITIKQSTSMRIRVLGRVPGTQYWEPLDDDDDDGFFPPGEEIPGILIVKLRDVSLTFANAGALKERLRRLERYGEGVRAHPADRPRRTEASVIIFELADVESIDASALQIIGEVVASYSARSVLVYWTNLRPHARARLATAGVLDLSGDPSHVQPNVQSALNSLNDTMISFQSL